MTETTPPSKDHVRCRAEYAYPGRPLEVLWEGIWFPVISVLQERLTPAGKDYRVLCEGGRSFWLTYDLAGDRWVVSMVE